MAMRKKKSESAAKPEGELAKMIDKLKGERSQAAFAQELGISRQRIIDWSRDHAPIVPSTSALVQMGNISPDKGMRRYFWQKANIDIDRLLEDVQHDFYEKREKTVRDDYVLLPVSSTADIATKNSSPRRVPFPATRISNPELAFCLEVDPGTPFIPGILGEGDLAVIDGSRTETSTLNSGLSAFYFESLPNYEITGSGTASATMHDGPKMPPGVRFGWLIPQSAGYESVTSFQSLKSFDAELSRYVVQLPSVGGGVGGRGTKLPLTEWSSPLLQPEELEKILQKKKIQILGTVIGWLASPWKRKN